jgi:hypothetical protein
MIPRPHRIAFFNWMDAHLCENLPTEEWITQMTAHAQAFLDKHHIREDGRAALTYYCKNTGRIQDGQADI